MTQVGPISDVDTGGAADPTQPSRTFYFRSRDGLRLYGEAFEPTNPRFVIVLVHGYAEHCGRYRELAAHLARHGFATLAFDMRGHGRSQGQRGHVHRFSQYLDDLDLAWNELSPELSKLPSILLGHSNGGLIVLRTIADPWRCPKRVAAAVLSSPFLRLKLQVSPAKKLTGRIASLALPTFSLPNALVVEHLTSDPQKQRERTLDTLCHDVASARWFTEAEATQKWVREFASRVTIPTLWLVSGGDQVADPAASREVADRIGGDAEYHSYPHLQHEVFNEIGREEIYDTIVEFVERKLG